MLENLNLGDPKDTKIGQIRFW